jgi:hypothetical protein
MPKLHTRLLADVIALGSPYPLVLTGGYAVRAHHLVALCASARALAEKLPGVRVTLRRAERRVSVKETRSGPGHGWRPFSA